MPESEVLERRPESTTALHELARDHSSRRRFLKMVGGTGAAGALAIFLAACGDEETGAGDTTTAASTSTAADAAGDLDILNYALTLEYLETDFYKKVIASGLFEGAQLDVIKTFGEQEQAHVDVLTATVKKLGGTPAAIPETTFPLENAKAVVTLAATVENLGAAAYLGEAGKIMNKEVLAAALAIHTVEARHAAALNTLLGKSVTPDGAFAKPATRDVVLAAVKPFIV